jgi:hypothetical protein
MGFPYADSSTSASIVLVCLGLYILPPQRNPQAGPARGLSHPTRLGTCAAAADESALLSGPKPSLSIAGGYSANVGPEHRNPVSVTRRFGW